MRRAIAIAAGMLLLAASRPADEAQTQLAAQQDAWNRGDLEAALARYCADARITWVDRKGVTRGFDAFAKDMREGFAAPASMGTMQTEILDARDIGKGRSLIVQRWSIERDGKRLMGGVSTQLWERCHGATRIVFEHAS